MKIYGLIATILVMSAALSLAQTPKWKVFTSKSGSAGISSMAPKTVVLWSQESKQRVEVSFDKSISYVHPYWKTGFMVMTDDGQLQWLGWPKPGESKVSVAFRPNGLFARKRKFRPGPILAYCGFGNTQYAVDTSGGILITTVASPGCRQHRIPNFPKNVQDVAIHLDPNPSGIHNTITVAWMSNGKPGMYSVDEGAITVE